MSGDKSDKSDKKAAKAAATPTQPTGAADLRSRVPAMMDDALNTLLANARRVLETGNTPQRNMATDLIPVIERELADRKAKKLAAHPPRKAAAKPRKPKVAKAEKEDDGD
jgi:hypothetical protein